MAQTIENMKTNYLKLEDITLKIKSHGLKGYLKFKNTGEYSFFTCEDCDGPILGHIKAKCRNGES